MIHQLKAVIGFQESVPEALSAKGEESGASASKVKVADLDLSPRVTAALEGASIKSAAGLARKTASALKELDGIGDKAIEEISVALAHHGLTLKAE
jgi:DNA-directed RNA polymerase alpha subunit